MIQSQRFSGLGFNKAKPSIHINVLSGNQEVKSKNQARGFVDTDVQNVYCVYFGTFGDVAGPTLTISCKIDYTRSFSPSLQNEKE